MGRKAIPIEPYIEKLEQAILVGATYELAAMYAGISASTYDRWRKQMATASPESSLGQLRERLRAAEGRAAIGWLAKIEKAASEGDYRAAIWKLERRYPEEYGRTVHEVEHSGAIGIVQLPSKAPDAETWLAETQHLHPEHNGHAS